MPSFCGQIMGSIPACAGEPGECLAHTQVSGVYPRVCGGTAVPLPSKVIEKGLSPRVRGNRQEIRLCGRAERSIPACAGEPKPAAAPYGTDRVYPRVCGGTHQRAHGARVEQGLSPRVRGNRCRSGCGAATDGSIPACAGEPTKRLNNGRTRRVYPRVCGGTRFRRRRRWRRRGLSPRVRGTEVREMASRSIFGLSPRVRGNPFLAAKVPPEIGSIPACAGEPRRRRGPDYRRRVYPRVCGGTGHFPPPTSRAKGLSPRVRGNPAAGAGIRV